MNRRPAMGVLMVLKYPSAKNHSLRSFQEFDDHKIKFVGPEIRIVARRVRVVTGVAASRSLER